MKLKRRKYQDLGNFYNNEVKRMKAKCPMGSLSDLERQNAWAIAEQKMLNYLLVLIIDLNVEIESIKEKVRNDNSN